MKICIVTDAWAPQTNGVVRTLETLGQELRRRGYQVDYVTPGDFKTIPMPTYPEIRLSLFPRRKLARILATMRPDAIHIATEGPLGMAARAWCLKRKFAFTTSYHTRFPEYLALRSPIPVEWSYKVMRWFHRPSAAVMVATASVRAELTERGFSNIVSWTRGVDLDLFRPQDKAFLDLPRPIALYVGRVAVEKNIEDFLRLDLPGSKLVVGDGPQLEELRQAYPKVRFVGLKKGQELSQYYAASDVFVFPSRTDTFGLVLLEALASGLPVAAYPVPGPLDVIGRDGRGAGHGPDRIVGALNEDLAQAVRDAQHADPADCRLLAEAYGWSDSAAQFLTHLEVARQDARTPVSA